MGGPSVGAAEAASAVGERYGALVAAVKDFDDAFKDASAAVKSEMAEASAAEGKALLRRIEQALGKAKAKGSALQVNAAPAALIDVAKDAQQERDTAVKSITSGKVLDQLSRDEQETLMKALEKRLKGKVTKKSTASEAASPVPKATGSAATPVGGRRSNAPRKSSGGSSPATATRSTPTTTTTTSGRKRAATPASGATAAKKAKGSAAKATSAAKGKGKATTTTSTSTTPGKRNFPKMSTKAILEDNPYFRRQVSRALGNLYLAEYGLEETTQALYPPLTYIEADLTAEGRNARGMAAAKRSLGFFITFVVDHQLVREVGKLPRAEFDKFMPYFVPNWSKARTRFGQLETNVYDTSNAYRKLVQDTAVLEGPAKAKAFFKEVDNFDMERIDEPFSNDASKQLGLTDEQVRRFCTARTLGQLMDFVKEEESS